jgi:hypothetical protein
MTVDVNIAVLVGQFVLAAVLVWIAFRKAPKERMTLDATTAAQYAQAAKLKGEENAALIKHVETLEARLDAVEHKKFKVCIEFLTGDPPEVLRAEIAPVIITDEETVVMKANDRARAKRR